MKNLIRIYKTMLRHWGFLLGGLFFMGGYALLSGMSITLIIPLFDDIFSPKTEIIIYNNITTLTAAMFEVFRSFFTRGTGSILNGNWQPLLADFKSVLNQSDPTLLLTALCGTVIAMIILKNIFFLIYQVFFANLRGLTIMEVRNKIYQNYLAQSLAFFHKNKVGDSLVRMINDVNIVGDMFIFNLYKLLNDALLLFVYARIAILLNAQLFFIGIIVLPLFSIGIGMLGRKIKKYARRIQEQSSHLFSNVEESLNSMPIIKAFSKEGYEYAKFTKINHRFFLFWRKSALYRALSEPLSEFNGTFIGITVLIIGGKQVLAGNESFSLGQFIAFLVAVFSMLHPIKTITKAYTDIKRAIVSLDRISEIINMTTEVKEAKHPVSKENFVSGIELQQVTFSYNGKENVLDNITFNIQKGKRIALVGASGSGKTTLVHLLSRLHDRSSGKILLDGENIENIRLTDLRSLFGIVTQESILFTDSIANNIRYGSHKQVTSKEIEKAARNAFAHEFIMELPDKYDTVLHPRGANLSGGQRQRLCIARAIVGNPPLLIFDEATSALDTEAEQNVQAAIEKTTRDRTVIIIAHRLSTVLSCDNIIVLEKGKIVSQGTHQDLMNACPKYQRMVQLQFRNHLEEVHEN